MQGITVILFDIDGTVLDTEQFIIKATEHALALVGFPAPEESVIKKTVGMPFPGYYVVLSGTNEKEKIEALVDAHRDFQYKNFHLAKLFPNALETLQALKEKGYKLAAVTTRSKKTSLQTLENAGIDVLFDTTISLEDAGEPKPSPLPLLKALENLNEKVDSAVMVGDSHLDIEAGKNAGTKTIRAIYGFNKENLENPKPDYVIADIIELLKIL